MTREEYKAKLKGLHPQMDCDLKWKYTQEYITSLEAWIAELEKLAVVWHKYPDEKPDDNRDCLVFGKAYCVMSSSIGVGYYENDEWVCEEIGDITHYAELPAPPEEQ